MVKDNSCARLTAHGTLQDLTANFKVINFYWLLIMI